MASDIEFKYGRVAACDTHSHTTNHCLDTCHLIVSSYQKNNMSLSTDYYRWLDHFNSNTDYLQVARKYFYDNSEILGLSKAKSMISIGAGRKGCSCVVVLVSSNVHFKL